MVDAVRVWEGRLNQMDLQSSIDNAELLLNFGDLCFGLGLYGKAQNHFEHALAIKRDVLEPDHPEILNLRLRLAYVLWRLDFEREAAEQWRSYRGWHLTGVCRLSKSGSPRFA